MGAAGDGKRSLPACRRALGPDHLITQLAATALALALVASGEAEPARDLGQDTLRRCRRALGPDHLVSLWAAGALTGALVGSGEVEQARALGQDTLEHCRRVLAPDHPITRYLTEVAEISRPVPDHDAATGHPDQPR